MIQSEKEITKYASKISYEETYLSADLQAGDITNMGYHFRYPPMWVNDNSTKKLIGLRRLEQIPSSETFNFDFLEVTDGDEVKYHVSVSVLPENSLTEILFEINRQIIEQSFSKRALHYVLTGTTLSMGIVDRDNGSDIDSYFGSTLAQQAFFINFLRFLNQSLEEIPDMLFYMTDVGNAQDTWIFNNVWDRKRLYFHSSFSRSNRQLLDKNNTHWEKPSKYYPAQSATSDFYIWFTTDGVNKVIPYYSDFHMDLCFVSNFERAHI